jgi:O-antigen/teichoic acid export membrane protein
MRESSFSRNTTLNFFGQVAVILLAVVSLPLLVAWLGDEQFGLLSILWILVGSLQVFDVGIGLGSAKFLSEHIAEGRRHEAAGIAQGTLLLLVPICLLVSAGLFAMTFVNFAALFNIPSALRAEAVAGLRVLLFLPPAIFIQNGLKNVLVAFQRFDVVNGLLVVYGVLQWGGAVTVLAVGGGFLDVVIAMVAARYIVMILTTVAAVRMLPEIMRVQPAGANTIQRLFRFGGWVSVSQLLGPAFGVLDRLFISALISLAAVTSFSVVTDVALRLLIIPLSFVGTLIPVVSGGWIRSDKQARVKSLYEKSLKYTFVIMLPIAFVLALFNKEILTVWLGAEFAGRSGTVLMIIALGLIGNALAQMPLAVLQSMGRPDIPAKVILAEIVAYGGLCFVLTDFLGIVGTAIAWSLRVTAEAAILLAVTHNRMKHVVSPKDSSYIWKSLAVLVAGGALLTWMRTLTGEVGILLAGLLLTLTAYGVVVWKTVFDANGRALLASRAK